MATRPDNRPELSTVSSAGANALVTCYATSAPGANTNIPLVDALGASGTTFKVGPNASAIRVTVCLTTTSVFDLRVTNGTTAYTQHFNGGTALTASCLYTFTIGARRYSTQNADVELSYAFRVATDSVIEQLLVEEVRGPVV